jgi:hypothetical protein
MLDKTLACGVQIQNFVDDLLRKGAININQNNDRNH